MSDMVIFMVMGAIVICIVSILRLLFLWREEEDLAENHRSSTNISINCLTNRLEILEDQIDKYKEFHIQHTKRLMKIDMDLEALLAKRSYRKKEAPETECKNK